MAARHNKEMHATNGNIQFTSEGTGDRVKTSNSAIGCMWDKSVITDQRTSEQPKILQEAAQRQTVVGTFNHMNVSSSTPTENGTLHQVIVDLNAWNADGCPVEEEGAAGPDPPVRRVTRSAVVPPVEDDCSESEDDSQGHREDIERQRRADLRIQAGGVLEQLDRMRGGRRGGARGEGFANLTAANQNALQALVTAGVQFSLSKRKKRMLKQSEEQYCK